MEEIKFIIKKVEIIYIKIYCVLRSGTQPEKELGVTARQFDEHRKCERGSIYTERKF